MNSLFAVPAASVIIPAHNAGLTIRKSLAALARQATEDPFEVIVVDDGSSDDTIAEVEAAPLEVTLLRQHKQGPGAARNLGARAAAGEVLAFTDADCVPGPDWLAAGLEAVAVADLVQGAVRPDPAVKRLPFDRTVWVTGERGLYECASLFVRRELFESVGGFEDLLGARVGKQLAEDTWLGWRLRRAGARTAFSPGAQVDHAVFRRSAWAYVGERARLVYFPALARQIPELRTDFFWRRRFIGARSAAFDAALGGGALTVGLGSPLPLVLATPYLWIWARHAIAWRRHAPVVALAELAADAVGFGALIVGSFRHRTLII